MSSTFGKIFSVTTWGESHGPAVGAVLDGCPAGLPITEEMIQARDTQTSATISSTGSVITVVAAEAPPVRPSVASPQAPSQRPSSRPSPVQNFFLGFLLLVKSIAHPST